MNARGIVNMTLIARSTSNAYIVKDLKTFLAAETKEAIGICGAKAFAMILQSFARLPIEMRIIRYFLLILPPTMSFRAVPKRTFTFIS